MDKKNEWASIFVKTMITSGLIIIGLNVYDNWNASNKASYHEKRLTIRQIESSDPLSFLVAAGNYKKSFWGTKKK